MDIDNNYLFMSANFNETCTELKMELGSYFYIPPNGNTEEMQGQAALDFLKQTSHGQQPELSNFAVLMFSPDITTEDLDYNLSVKIPEVKDVLYKKNKYDNKKKRKVVGESMTIPSIKMLKIKEKWTLDKYNQEILVNPELTLQPAPNAELTDEQWRAIQTKICNLRKKN